MRWVGFAVAVSASLAVGGAACGQDKAAAPVDLCLTNACSAPLSSIVKPRSVGEAISAGNAQAVRDLGGSPGQAMEALMQRLKTQAASPDAWASFGGFADTSDGSTLTFTNNTDFSGPPGVAVVGAIERRAPDGSTQNLYLTDNGGGIWVRPGFDRGRR